MQTTSSILAPTYVFEGMRGILVSGEFSPLHLLAGIALALAAVVLAQLVFMRTYKTVVRLGLLARYSAESL